jgi:putative flippase GtrA
MRSDPTTAGGQAISDDASRPGRIAVAIPAYQPAPALVDLVRALVGTDGFAAVIVVDDGSDSHRQSIFRSLEQLEGVEVLRHHVNLGKGAALKTALNHVGVHHPDVTGVVTADADGQHAVEDVVKVSGALLERPGQLVLGARHFDENVPWRSRLGNVLTRQVMRFIGGWKMADTQTGLRGIPRFMWPSLLRLRSQGYEFELDMLLIAKRLGVIPFEVPIATIYHDGNRASHFNPIVDSMRIYFVLLRFFLSSITSAGVDNLVFILCFHLWPSVLLAQVTGRVVSATVNFLLNKKVVFQSSRRTRGLATKYVGLVILSGALSYALILLLHEVVGVPVVVSKLLAETVVFLFNFAIQRDFIFTPPARRAGGKPSASPLG